MSHRSSEAVRGLVAYLALALSLSWIPAWLLSSASLEAPSSWSSRLLLCSLYYGLTAGWQPLAAVLIVRRWIDSSEYVDHGLKPARASFVIVAAIGSLACVLGATVVHGFVSEARASWWTEGPASEHDSLPGAFGTAVGFVAAVVLVWGQCLAEEIGWRGFFLARLIQRVGVWKGLLLHGVVWGLWYAPLLAPTSSSAAFVVTCMLLGSLLGWLRLASGSLVPSIVANAGLTLAAGLPLILRGVDVGVPGAIYGPPGWAPMALAVLVLALGPHRKMVGPTPELAPALWDRRTLH
jgi:membrane protease YdiL (CAAX protease family)